MVKGSARVLSVAVRNLVENAVKQTPENSMVAIDIGADVTVRIRDQGQGVPVAFRQKILDCSWRRRGGGNPAAPP